MNELELMDTIRIAQRELKSRVLRRRESEIADQAKKKYRFWDRPLPLDWSEVGLPKLQYPRGRAWTTGDERAWATTQAVKSHMNGHTNGRPTGMANGVEWDVFALLSPNQKNRPQRFCHFAEEIDWNVFRMLGAMGRMKAQTRIKEAEVDWNVFSMLNPNKIDAKIVKNFDSYDDMGLDELNVDWSESRLPYYNHATFARRRRRRNISRRLHESKQATREPPTKPTKTTTLKNSRVNSLRNRNSARPVVPIHRIQQPAGGGR